MVKKKKELKRNKKIYFEKSTKMDALLFTSFYSFPGWKICSSCTYLLRKMLSLNLNLTARIKVWS